MAKRTTDPKLAVAYIRISTDKERQALGAEAQREAIESWAAQNAIRIVHWQVEEISGGAKLDERTGLLEALATVQAHRAGHLVVQRLDRFSRDPVSAALAEAELQKHGAKLSIALGCDDSDDPGAEFMRAILIAAGRFERRMISARIKAALAVKKRRGECIGECPVGYDKDEAGKLVKNESEQHLMARISELSAEGVSQRKIAKVLESEGFVGRSGKPYSQTQISRVVRLLPMLAA